MTRPISPAGVSGRTYTGPERFCPQITHNMHDDARTGLLEQHLWHNGKHSNVAQAMRVRMDLLKQ